MQELVLVRNRLVEESRVLTKDDPYRLSIIQATYGLNFCRYRDWQAIELKAETSEP